MLMKRLNVSSQPIKQTKNLYNLDHALLVYNCNHSPDRSFKGHLIAWPLYNELHDFIQHLWQKEIRMVSVK